MCEEPGRSEMSVSTKTSPSGFKLKRQAFAGPAAVTLRFSVSVYFVSLLFSLLREVAEEIKDQIGRASSVCLDTSCGVGHNGHVGSDRAVVGVKG